MSAAEHSCLCNDRSDADGIIFAEAAVTYPKFACLLLASLLLGGCSGDDEDAGKTHVWKEQTDTMDKARAVEGILQESADDERKKIEEQTQ